MSGSYSTCKQESRACGHQPRTPHCGVAAIPLLCDQTLFSPIPVRNVTMLPTSPVPFPAFRLRAASLAERRRLLAACRSLRRQTPRHCPLAAAHLDQAPTAPTRESRPAGVLHAPPAATPHRDCAGNNRDLRVAALRVEEASATFRIQRSDRFPAMGVGAQGGRARVPGDLNMSADRRWAAKTPGRVGFLDHLGTGSVVGSAT